MPNSALANSSVSVSGHSISLGTNYNLASSDVGLGSVTNNLQTQAAVVPNTAPSSGQILIGIGAGGSYAPQTVGGDIVITSAGVTSIGTNKVTYAKFQQVAASSFLGNNTGAAANMMELTPSQATATACRPSR